MAVQLKYPLNLTENDTDTPPLIMFTCLARESGAGENFYGNVRGKGLYYTHIFFPSPGNIQFQDQAQFSQAELGASAAFLGGASAGRAGAGKTVSGVLGLGKKILTDITGQVANAVGTDVMAQAQLIKGVVSNPNTATTFKSNGIRNFTFTFKMIAQTPKETDMIKAIHHTFRRNTYAVAAGLRGIEDNSGTASVTLQYPPVWNIKFLDLNQPDSINKFIPKIYSCFLTNFSSTFNSQANMYHIDGAPMEVDISITMTETRQLTRQDIDNMENLGVDQLIGIGDSGNVASVATNNRIPSHFTGIASRYDSSAGDGVGFNQKYKITGGGFGRDGVTATDND
tara:strand:- start:4396 stop:5415 length:1020 start_codon:yes stop_codon:yes gene_type:complete